MEKMIELMGVKNVTTRPMPYVASRWRWPRARPWHPPGSSIPGKTTVRDLIPKLKKAGARGIHWYFREGEIGPRG
jgi:hypothetical protein